MSLAARRWIRILFAGPGAIVVTIVMMGGMTMWLPGGVAGIDNLVMPLVLMPLIWAALFFHACLDRRLGRVALVAFALLCSHAALVANNLLRHSPTVSHEAEP